MTADVGTSELGTLERHVEHVPAAFAVTCGDRHTLVYANAVFRTLVAPDGRILLGRPLADAIEMRDTSELTTLLDRSLHGGVVHRNVRIGRLDDGSPPLSCTVWPDLDEHAAPAHLVIELRSAEQEVRAFRLQREIAERLVLGALREQDAADDAEDSRRDAIALAIASRRLSQSLDEGETIATMSTLTLPSMEAWCIVDTFNEGDPMKRRSFFQPDDARQQIVDALEARWADREESELGLRGALKSGMPWVIENNASISLVKELHGREPFEALRSLGVGPLLTVPLVVRDNLLGALTFVGGRHDPSFTPSDVELAEDLASRGAVALDRARAYGEAIALKILAEAANEAKSAFLGMMSHELRTPLNAIGGYVDIIDMELHGPVTEAQHRDLSRIRSSQQYLTGLITDLLNLAKVNNGVSVYEDHDILMEDALEAGIALVEPLFGKKGLTHRLVMRNPGIVALGDREKLIQIVVNLLSNSVKFTANGGHIMLDCETTASAVVVRVCDSGMGIPRDKLDVIFDPFVQVNGGTLRTEGGVGLGLAISRALARGMHGDLTVQSSLGQGACFTLTLPRERRNRGAGTLPDQLVARADATNADTRV